MQAVRPQPSVGLALGSGAARGWAHIGVIRTLQDAGIPMHIVAGSSIGALVGAAYASGNLAELESWVRRLQRIDVVRLLDPALTSGGFIQGERLMEVFVDYVPKDPIESLDKVFACTATDLVSGREIWIDKGPLGDAVRASIALPGLFTPVRREGRWVVDGGLTDPVPVTLCRSMGANCVIAVNLNTGIVGRHLRQTRTRTPEHRDADALGKLLERLGPLFGWARVDGLSAANAAHPSPGMMEIVATAINIMQDRITRSRLAGDPPHVMIIPRLAEIGLMEFHRAGEAIEAGSRATRQALPAIEAALEDAY